MKVNKLKLLKLIREAIKESTQSSLINEMNSMRAAYDSLRASGIANPTKDQARELAKSFEDALMFTMLSQKDAYSSAHNSTKVAQQEAGRTDLINISNFLEGFARPQKGQYKRSVSPRFTNLELTNHPKGQGYGFKKINTAPRNDAQLAALMPEERNYLKVVDVSGASPGTAAQFATCAINSASGAQDSDTQPMPDELGSKIEIGVAATLAYLDDSQTYYARTDTAPGQDLFRSGDDVTFECKFSKNEKSEINTNFGGSQPSMIKTNKFYVFLSSDRSYLVNSTILAGIGNVGTDTIPANSSDAENQKMNAKLMEHLYNQQSLKQEFSEILADFVSSTTVFYKKGSAVVRAPKTGNYTDKDSNIRKAIRDKSKSGMPAVTATYSATGPQALTPDPPTIERLINAIIKTINRSPEKGRYINSLRYIDMINAVFVERATTTAISGPVTAGDVKSPHFRTEAITALGPGASNREIKEKTIELYNADWNSFLVNDRGNLKPYGGSASQGSMGYAGGCFLNLINYLIYAWNLKDDPALAKLGQDFYVTAEEGGMKGFGRQQAEVKSGRNYQTIFKDQDPTGAAMTIMALINHPTTLTDNQKKILVNQLYGDYNHPYADLFPDEDGFPQGIYNLDTVARDIQGDLDAMSEMFIEFMRSEEGRRNIVNSFLFDDAIQIGDSAILTNINQTIEQYYADKTRSMRAQIGSDIASQMDAAYQQKLQSSLGNVISDVIDTLTKEENKYDLLKNAIPKSFERQNKFYSIYDRDDMWENPEYDKHLFNLFFKNTISGPDDDIVLTEIDPSGQQALSNRILAHLGPNVLQSSLEYSLLQLVDEKIEEAIDETRPAIKQNLSQENLYNIENQYKLSLSSEELNAYNSLDREAQILQMLNAGVIDEPQAKVLRRTKDPLKALKRVYDENPFEDSVTDAIPIRENAKIYENILKELLKYSK